MLRKFSDWRKINEVQELTEIQLWGKYFNNIISIYRKYPGIRPSRDPKQYQNAKGSKTLAEFVNSKGGGTSAEILISVINEWYDWPDQSSTKKILIDYISNNDDLSNLSIGVVAGSMPGEILTSVGGLNVVAKQFLRRFAKSSPKTLVKALESFDLSKKRSSPLNEGVAAAIAAELGLWALGTGINYALYGSEEISDDPLLFWTAPYLPSFQGLLGDNPLKATYVMAFNFAMALIYDAWNLSMGQEKYGDISNPILSWQNESNYISQFFDEFYDDRMKPGFKTFMSSLNTSCLNDSKKPELFKSSPFYYTAEKMRVIFEDGAVSDIPIQEWQKWVRTNYQKYYIIPSGATEFKASLRKGGFRPLEKLGITDQAIGDPFREITVKWNDGTVSKSSLLQFETWLITSGKAQNYSPETQNITQGGSNIELSWREESPGEAPSIPTEDKRIVDAPSTPSIKKETSFDEVSINLQAERLESFTGMGDI